MWSWDWLAKYGIILLVLLVGCSPVMGAGQDDNTMLLLHLDGADGAQATTDATGRHETITFVTDAELDTEYKKWGTASLLTNNYHIYLPDSTDWDLFGSNDDEWTVDFWYRQISSSSGIVAQKEDNDNKWGLSHTTMINWGLWFVVEDDNDSKMFITSGVEGVIDDSDWHHIMFCVLGNGSTKVLGIYLDGQQVAYSTLATNHTFAGYLYVGDFPTAQGEENMDEFRVQKSNIFNASPNNGESDTIVVPTEAYGEDGTTIHNVVLYNAIIH